MPCHVMLLPRLGLFYHGTSYLDKWVTAMPATRRPTHGTYFHKIYGYHGYFMAYLWLFIISIALLITVLLSITVGD